MNNDHFFRTSIGPAISQSRFQPARRQRPSAEDLVRTATAARIAAATSTWVVVLLAGLAAATVGGIL